MWGKGPQYVSASSKLIAPNNKATISDLKEPCVWNSKQDVLSVCSFFPGCPPAGTAHAEIQNCLT